MKKALIIGATSGIGQALAYLMVKKGYLVGGSGRRTAILSKMHADMGDSFRWVALDIRQMESISGKLTELIGQMGGMDICVISSGISLRNRHLKWDIEQEVLQTNIMGWTRCALYAMAYFSKQNSGHLVGISSIARRFGYYNPAYNASKAFEDIYMSGLSLRLKHSPIMLTKVFPGFVHTPMTADRARLFWAATAPKAAQQLLKGIEKKQKIVYLTRRWRYVDGLLHCLPQRLFEKLL